MFRLLKYLNKKEWLCVFFCLLIIIGMVWLELEVPNYMYDITLLLQTGGSTLQILEQGAYMLLCALGAGVLAIFVRFFSSKIAANFGDRIRRDIYMNVQRMSQKEVNEFSVSSLLTRTTNDVYQAQTFIAMGLQPIMRAPIMAIWALCIILGKDWKWSAATGISIAFLIFSLGLICLLVLPKVKVLQKQNDDVNKVARDKLKGVRVVRAFNAEKYEYNKFEKVNTDLTSTNLFINRIMAVLSPLMTLIMSGLSLAIYWIGAYVVNSEALLKRPEALGDMMVFSSYAMQIVLAFIIFAMIFIMFPRAEVSARRINEVLGKKSSIISGDKKFENGKSGEIEFNNVSFKYNKNGEKECLKNITFKAKKGDFVAIMGATGSGKSTLVNLISRIYDADNGEILVNGKDIKQLDLAELHNKVGYVPQKAQLFSGTIESNIKFGDNANFENLQNVESAIKYAQADDVISAKEGGNQSQVLAGGVNFSGGQKQRLSIARAFARNPEFLILDDSFSALDYETDKKLRKAIKENYADTTTFVVAQRIGTVRDADLILVLDEGEIVGKGKHDELMKTCETYKEIALSQLSKEEL